MFTKAQSLAKIVKCKELVYYVQKIRELKIEESYNTQLACEDVLAVLKLVRDGREYYFGVFVSPDIDLYNEEGNYKDCHIVNLNPDVHVFKQIESPCRHSNLQMGLFIVNSVNLTRAPFSITYKKMQDEIDRKLKYEEEMAELEAQIAQDKLAQRAKRKAESFDGMRETIADESKKVLQQISIDQHDEVITTITKIVNEVADKIVQDNYKLVENYYDQAYLQTVQLEERIREELKVDYENVVQKIESDFLEQARILDVSNMVKMRRLEATIAALAIRVKIELKKVAVKKPAAKKPLKTAAKKPLKTVKKKK